MKIVFFGTPDYVIPLLETLHKTFKEKGKKSPITAVVTQSPKPTGRKKILSYSSVDTWAYKKGIPVFFDASFLITRKINTDIGILASYGKIVPEEVIKYFRYGILNIHPSILPSFRGASPVQAAIATGLRETGVTVIKLDNELDHGPIISSFKEEISNSDTTETLRRKLFEKSAEFVKGLLPPYLSGKIIPKNQDHKLATFTKIIKKTDAFIDPSSLKDAINGNENNKNKKVWNLSFIKDFTSYYSGVTIDQFVRAMWSWPVAWTEIKLKSGGKIIEKRLKITKTHIEESKDKKRLLVIDEVQLEGKNPVSWKQFQEAYPEIDFSKNSS